MEQLKKIASAQARLEKIVVTQSRSIALMTARIGMIHEAMRDLVKAMNDNTKQMAELCAVTTGYVPNIGDLDGQDGEAEELGSQEIPEPAITHDSNTQASSRNQQEQAHSPLRPQEGDIRLDGQLP